MANNNMPYQTPDSIIEPQLNGANLTIPKASQACHSCRRQKRRCDKKLPACSLCDRMNRACDYSDASPAPTADDFNALRAKLIELEGRLLAANEGSMSAGTPYQPTPPGHPLSPAAGLQQPPAVPNYILAPPYQLPQVNNRFPAIALLDADSFSDGRIEVPSPQIDIPLEVLELLGDGPAVQSVINEYFETVHMWFPVVSKKRLNRNMHSPMWEAGPDLALLFLCMKLTTQRPQEGLEHSHHPVYTAAKRFIALLEAGGVISLAMHQSYILIALFEIGHSIFPAAWMTVGSCRRYGMLLGLHDQERGLRLLVPATTWTEMEERRRGWWAVVILERLVASGSVGRFEVPEDPDDQTALPSFTELWDIGELPNVGFVPLSTPISEPIGPFGRLCQAALMAGRVQKHHRKKNHAATEKYREASGLYVELSELARTLVQEAATAPSYLMFVGPMSVCFSALCCLCDPYACQPMRAPTQSQEEATMQVQAVEGLRSVSDSIKELSQQVANCTPNSLDIDHVSIFLLDALYCGATNYAWDVRESGNAISEEGLDAIRQCLRRFTARWRAAQEYLRILEAQEFAFAVNGGVA